MNILLRNNVHVLEGAGPTLVYAHGFGCSQNMWDRITSILKVNGVIEHCTCEHKIFGGVTRVNFF